MITSLLVTAAPLLAVESASNSPISPRDFYNDGTQKLRDGKLREAESSLQAAVASNVESVQPPALYNLGQARFRQGVEALKEGPQRDLVRARSEMAAALGGSAIQTADAALAGEDLNAIVAAYMQGRGARKELKSASEAVKRALDSYGGVLRRWQRASGDFKSAHELRPSDSDARSNGEIVDRHIAELVDQLNQMQQMMQGIGKEREELGERMKQLKGRLPEGMQPQGMGDEDEEEDGKPKDLKPGQQEAPSRDGRETFISPEDAARLLETLRLDGNRKLPIGAREDSPAQKRPGKQW